MRNFILCLVLLIGTLVVYRPSLNNGFVNYDDEQYITENVHVQDGLKPGFIKWAFTTFECFNWHPLTWLSFAFDVQLFKLNPEGHHAISMILHAFNVLLLFLLLQRATGWAWTSFLVAALFTLHPINVESVAWASERKNILSMLFLLLALHAYGGYARKPGFWRYLIVVICFALGLMAKPQIITLPFVLLLWDFWPLKRISADESLILVSKPSLPPQSFLHLILEKVPLLFLSLASAIITIKAQVAGGALNLQSMIPLVVRLENAVVSYFGYILKAFWPWHLAPLYPHPGKSVLLWQVIISAIFLLLITIIVLKNRRHRYLVTGWFWFLGTLVPMIGLVQVGNQALADRYAYLPFIGLFIMVGWGITETFDRLRRNTPWPALIVSILLIVLASITTHQISIWHDTETLWSHTLRVTYRNYTAHDYLGKYLMKQGRWEEAFPHFIASLNIFPNNPQTIFDIGVYYHAHGNLKAAVAQYKKAIQGAVNPRIRADVYGNLGSAYRQLKDYSRARENYQAALRIDPNRIIALVGLGILAQKSGNFNEAIRLYSQALVLQPTDVGYLLLAKALRQAGRQAKAGEIEDQVRNSSLNFDEAKKAADNLLNN